MAKSSGRAKRKKTRTGARRSSPKKRKAAAARATVVKPTVVNLRFSNEGAAMAKKKRSGSKKGAHRSAHRAGAHKATRRRRRRNPTFGAALAHVAGAAAAAFGVGVATTWLIAQVPPSKDAKGNITTNPLALYGIPLAAALAGALVAMKMPLVGAGVVAGAASPFVMPVAAKMIASTSSSPTTTVNALRALAMGRAANWREMNQYPGRTVNGIAMSSVYAG